MRQWLDSWEDFRIEAEEFLGDGDVVVVLVVLRARARSSGAPMETRSAHLHVFRGDLLVRMEIYPSREAALRAAGLDSGSA
jgi:ketosteroid isomerase-like protein